MFQSKATSLASKLEACTQRTEAKGTGVYQGFSLWSHNLNTAQYVAEQGDQPSIRAGGMYSEDRGQVHRYQEGGQHNMESCTVQANQFHVVIQSKATSLASELEACTQRTEAKCTGIRKEVSKAMAEQRQQLLTQSETIMKKMEAVSAKVCGCIECCQFPAACRESYRLCFCVDV